MNKNIRLSILIFNDIFLILISTLIALIVRSEKFPINDAWTKPFIISSIIYIGLFFIFKVDQEYFKYFNFQSLKKYFYISIIYSLTFIALLFFFKFYATPRSLGILQPPIFFTLLIISRYGAKEFLKSKQTFINQEILIIYGDTRTFYRVLSDQGEYFSSHLLISSNEKDNITRSFQGKKIYNISKLEKITNRISKALFVIDQKNLSNLDKQIIFRLSEKNLRFLSVNFDDEKINYKPLDYHDYLFKSFEFSLNKKFYQNKTILISGAGGSVGMALTRELLKIDKIKLLLVDNSEFNLFKLKDAIKDFNNYQIYLLNILDKKKISKVFDNQNIDVVIHAAAYKHVNILQNQKYEAIENNYLSTKILCDLSIDNKVKNFLFISTDKAVRPTSIMGVSKRLAEIYLQNKAHNNKNTKVSIVRFGNVLDSSGSVIPIFLDQIQKKSSVTVTDRKVERYFMSISQAAKLVLESNSFMKSGIYHLDMGKPINIWNLAEKLIKIYGYHPTDKKSLVDTTHILIKEIGLFDGEKLFEELLIDGKHKSTNNQYIFESVEENLTNDFQEIISSIEVFLAREDLKIFDNIIKNAAINYQE